MDPAETGGAPAATSLTPTGDGSATLTSARYGQTFHSHHGAVQESLHVFVGASGLAEVARERGRVSVLEVGFGTGLNFLLSAAAVAGTGGQLDYVALERDLLPGSVLEPLGYDRHAGEWFGRLLEFRESVPEVVPEGSYGADWPGVNLELRLGDATGMTLEAGRFQAVYLDAFSPDVNPELWTPVFLARLADTLAPGGRLVTYSVKGRVRRDLGAAGLTTRKLPGPSGGKREMLLALKPGSEATRESGSGS